ncbi:MAG: type II secretion system protein GspG [Planctomycetota bacterium]
MRRGLTLVELLVVLTILVALTTVAIRATEGTLQQSRYDATVRTLQAIEDAVLGPAGVHNPDGTPRGVGFLADTARLPHAGLVDGSLHPVELWQKQAAFAEFDLVNSGVDPAVIVGTGWRGPYLRLPPASGESKVLDGWGNPFLLLKRDGSDAGESDEVARIRSLGADGQDGGSGFNADLEVTFVDSMTNRVDAMVSGRVTIDKGGGPQDPEVSDGNVVVALFTPDPVTGTLKEAKTLLPPTGGPLIFVLPETGVAESFPVTAGPRVIRAYQGPGSDADSVIGGPATYSSSVMRLDLPAGGQTVDLVLE